MILVLYALLVLAALYIILLLVIVLNTQKVCECNHCHTAMHLERTNRPLYVRRLYDYLPLKYFRCRRCHRTFYLNKDTPDSEPESMKDSAPKPKASYT
jgi:transposase-like protein